MLQSEGFIPPLTGTAAESPLLKVEEVKEELAVDDDVQATHRGDSEERTSRKKGKRKRSESTGDTDILEEKGKIWINNDLS